ncbi:MAG: hypothetical protein ACMUJM_20290 [bacterium]
MSENKKNSLNLFRIFWILVLIGITSYLYILYKPYLLMPQHTRHLDTLLHNRLKPSGTLGHGLGIAGGIAMVLCTLLYTLRKKFEVFECMGRLSLWLEIHIFLGLLGPILIVFHTALKFNGVIGLGFWLMFIIVISGIFGKIFFGHCFWNITKKYELAQNIDFFVERDLRAASVNSSIIRGAMELTPPNFPSDSGLIKALKEWAYIKKEASRLFILIDENYGDKGSEDYNELQKWATEVVSRLRQLRAVSILNIYLSVLNHWALVHKLFSYILFFIMALHVFLTVFWGYSWLL